MTYDLFGEPDQADSQSSTRIEMPDADVLYFPQLFSSAEADRLLALLLKGVSWKQEHIKLYGKTHPIPRLTAWYGDEGKSYIYSGIKVDAAPWTTELLEIKERIEGVADTSFNSVLLNLYRDGSDSVSWHADDEPELGANPTIGSVSLGEARPFHLKHKRNKDEKRKVELAHGSFLLMQGATQHHWLHQVSKSSRQMAKRINLTFRNVA